MVASCDFGGIWEVLREDVLLKKLYDYPLLILINYFSHELHELARIPVIIFKKLVKISVIRGKVFIKHLCPENLVRLADSHKKLSVIGFGL